MTTVSRTTLSASIALLLGLATVAGCSSAPADAPPDSPGGESTPVAGAAAPPDVGSGGGGDASLMDAAAAVTDPCTLMPMDLVATIIPDADPPESQQFPPFKCRVSNGTSALEVTIAAYDAVDPLVPNTSVPGLGVAAYLQEQVPDDAYLKVILTPDGGVVYVEVAGHDGQDHEDDAIALAQRILEALQ